MGVGELFWGLPLTYGQVGLAMLVFCLASALQGVAGYGSVVISGPFLVLIEPRFIPGPVLLCGIVITSLVLLRDGLQVELSRVVQLSLSRAVGSVIGVLLLMQLSPDGAAAALAVIMLGGVGAGIAGVKVRPTVKGLALTGFMSGIAGTVAGLAGAVTALLVQDEQGIKLRGSMAAYLLPGAAVSVILIALVGRLGEVELKLFVLLLPSVCIGYGISSRYRHTLDRFISKPMVLSLASFAALTVLGKFLLKV